MMGICIASAAATSFLAASSFTLAWTHTIERTAWEEDWRVISGGRLELVEARVKGSGAGMEPPEGSHLENGWWRYRPDRKPLTELRLADLGAEAGRWRICAEGRCQEIGSRGGGDGILITVCEPP